MTEKQEKRIYKRYAKEMLKKHTGVSVPMTRMILLESGWNNGPNYVMFEDCKTGIQYQVTDRWAETWN